MTKKSGLFGLVILLGSGLLILTSLQEGEADVRLANVSQSEEPKAKIPVQAQNVAIAGGRSEPIPKIVFQGVMHYATHPEKSVALLKVADIRTSSFHIKEKVAEGYEVVSIEPEKVVIANFATGKTVQLQLTFDPSGEPSTISKKASAVASLTVGNNAEFSGRVKSENLSKPLDEQIISFNNDAFLAASQNIKK